METEQILIISDQTPLHHEKNQFAHSGFDLLHVLSSDSRSTSARICK